MFEHLEKRGAEAPAREPSPSQLNTANYGNFLKVRERQRKRERTLFLLFFVVVIASPSFRSPVPPPLLAKGHTREHRGLG